MDLVSDRGRRVSVDELNTTRLLAHARQQAHQRKLDDIVIVDLDGRQLDGYRKVTSEVSMHLAVYRHRDDVTAVIHSHPPIATAFACVGRGLEEMLCQEAAMTLGVVPLATYATTGTEEVAASLAPFIPDHDAILMANHGAVSYGTTILEAFQKMEIVEHLANIALVAHQLGGAVGRETAEEQPDERGNREGQQDRGRHDHPPPGGRPPRG